jgi:hypothetical protein
MRMESEKLWLEIVDRLADQVDVQIKETADTLFPSEAGELAYAFAFGIRFQLLNDVAVRLFQMRDATLAAAQEEGGDA